MRYKVRPADFIVEERLQIRLRPEGPFTIYRVRKRRTTTLGVQAQIAASLNIPRSEVVFPALKDKQALALQHAAVRGSGPPRLKGDGFEADRVGYAARRLTPGDIGANQFTVTLRDLSAAEAAQIEARLRHIQDLGLPNYFDEQRFGSLVHGEVPIGKRILLRDAEGALRSYLTQPFVGDPEPVRTFKAFAARSWGDWDAMFEAAPRPSNYRSVLTYLRDHPIVGVAAPDAIYRKALNLVNQRLLSLYLSAYQSLLWNRIAGRFLASRLDEEAALVRIGREALPLYNRLPQGLGRDTAIPLPSHRAVYSSPDLAAIVEQVLAEEGLRQADLKARILTRAYVSRGSRSLLLFPESASALPAQADELFTGQSKRTVRFTLPRGSYATLVLRVLAL